MKTKEEMVSSFLERFCTFNEGTKTYNRIKSAIEGVWQCGFANGNKEGYDKGHHDGLSAGRASVEADKTIAYQQGLEEGQGQTLDKWQDGDDIGAEESFYNGVECGCFDVWNALKYWYKQDSDKEMKTFLGYKNMKDIVLNYHPQVFILQIKDYQQKLQERIHVGDEVRSDEEDVIGIVTKIWHDYTGTNYDLLLKNGSLRTWNANDVKKTDRHFDEVEQLLKAMEGK